MEPRRSAGFALAPSFTDYLLKRTATQPGATRRCRLQRRISPLSPVARKLFLVLAFATLAEPAEESPNPVPLLVTDIEDPLKG
jgi:hypothetical protein